MKATLFENGTLLTQNPRAPRAEALLVRDGRVVAVGARDDIASLAGRGVERVDLEGGTLVPGFNDSHVHVWKVGQLLTSILDLRPVESLDALFGLLRRRDAELGGEEWLLGRGFNEARMKEGRQPTRQDLDAVAAHRPMALTRTCGHMLVASSRALELAGVSRDTPDPPGGAIERDEHGEPTGLLQETAMGLVKAVMPEPGVAEYASMIRAAHRTQLEKGITSATDAGAYPDLIQAYRNLERDGALAVRSNVMGMRLADEEVRPIPLPERFVSDWLRVDSVKLFADGGLSGATAALRSRYRHRDIRGLVRVEEDALFELAREARDAGLRVCTHAIGDAAIDIVLHAYDRLAAPGSRIEHFGLPDAEQIEHAQRSGTIVAPQAIFIHSLGANFRRYLTDDYLERCYPIRSMVEAGLVVALGSDAPVVADDSPLLGMEAAVTRRDLEGIPIALEEALTVEQALEGYTLGGAIASGDADNRGTLDPGKWADMVLLDRNPTEVPPDALSTVRVLKTFVAGEAAFSATG